MITIICGSRIATKEETYKAIEQSGFSDQITVVSSGKDKRKDKKTGIMYGADYWGEQWAKEHGIPVDDYPAKWAQHGLSAGPHRNSLMALRSEACIAVNINHSKGTSDMVGKARALELRTYVMEITR